MKPTTEQIIDWGRTALNETGALIPAEWNMKLLEAICSAAYEAGRKDENEACIKTLEDFPQTRMVPVKDTWRMGLIAGAHALRRRGENNDHG